MKLAVGTLLRFFDDADDLQREFVRRVLVGNQHLVANFDVALIGQALADGRFRRGCRGSIHLPRSSEYGGSAASVPTSVGALPKGVGALPADPGAAFGLELHAALNAGSTAATAGSCRSRPIRILGQRGQGGIVPRPLGRTTSS